MPVELSRAVVLNRAGQPAPLETYWANGPALVFFLRHFGCVGCSEQIAELSPRLPELALGGLRAVFVGNGAPAFIDGFLERTGLATRGVDVVTDPSLVAFRAAGLVRSRWGTIGFSGLRDLARAVGHGHLPRKAEGDLYQQGGSLLVDADGAIAYYHRSESLGDHPAPSDLIEAALCLLVKTSAIHV